MRRLAVAGGAAALAAVALAAPASAAPSQLKTGDTGAAVLCLQKGLNLETNNWQSNATPLALDGVFGAATKAKVNQHKAYFGLPEDGIFGKAAGNGMNFLASNATTTAAATWYSSCSSQIPHG